MKRTNLGEFEELVLLTVSVLYQQAYGISIKDEIEKQTGRNLSISAVHAVLTRLEKKGFVVSWMGGATQERGGRRKRFFKVTSAGQYALVEVRNIREKLWKLIPDFSFEGGRK
ncbi:PadR family transcriptional regulator [candidate division KSB1 bacterium]|nr:PadR family transcriptional regulator [candidate division KSB1 bacterium]